MTQHNQKPNSPPPVSERRHSDPPGFWATVILSSFVIHLFIFGMLRLWLTLRINNVLAASNFIPIEVIANASETRLTPPTQPITSTQTPKQVPVRSTPSTSVPANSPPPSATNPSVSPSRIPTVRKSATINSAPTQSQKPSPVPNNSQNQPSETQQQQQTPSTNPKSSTNQGNQSQDSTTSASPSPNSSGSSQTNPNSSDSQLGSISISSIGEPSPIPNDNEVLHPNDPNYNDRLATLLQGSTQLSSDEFKELGIMLEQDLELKVIVLIDKTGKATLLRVPSQGLLGNLTPEITEQLAKKSLAKLMFNPTLMAGQPVLRDYTLTLKISPNPK